MAFLRLVRTMDAVAVERAGPDTGQIAVPDLVGVFRQHHALGFRAGLFVEQAQFDAVCVSGKDRKIGAVSIPVGTALVRITRFDVPGGP